MRHYLIITMILANICGNIFSNPNKYPIYKGPKKHKRLIVSGNIQDFEKKCEESLARKEEIIINKLADFEKAINSFLIKKKGISRMNDQFFFAGVTKEDKLDIIGIELILLNHENMQDVCDLFKLAVQIAEKNKLKCRIMVTDLKRKEFSLVKMKKM